MNKIWWKKIHNVLGLASALFLTLLLVTGLMLNHPSKLEEGRIETLAVDPADSRKVYFAKKDGLYYSTDQGRNLQEVSMLYPPQEVVDIAFSPDDFQKVFLVEKWGGILFSEDGGRIWSKLRLPFDPQADGVELERLSVGSGGRMLLLTSHGWLNTSDGGVRWDETHFDREANPLYRLVLTLHNGYFFGPFFVWIYDFSAVSLLILIVSGIVLWNIGRKLA